MLERDGKGLTLPETLRNSVGAPALVGGMLCVARGGEGVSKKHCDADAESDVLTDGVRVSVEVSCAVDEEDKHSEAVAEAHSEEDAELVPKGEGEPLGVGDALRHSDGVLVPDALDERDAERDELRVRVGLTVALTLMVRLSEALAHCERLDEGEPLREAVPHTLSDALLAPDLEDVELRVALEHKLGLSDRVGETVLLLLNDAHALATADLVTGDADKDAERDAVLVVVDDREPPRA